MRPPRDRPYASEAAMRESIRRAHQFGPVWNPELWTALNAPIPRAPRGQYNRPAGENVTKEKL